MELSADADPVEEPGEPDPAGDPEFRGARAQQPLERALADQHQLAGDLRGQAGEGLEQPAQALAIAEPADIEDGTAALAERDEAEEGGVDAIGHHRGPMVQAVSGLELGPYRVRDHHDLRGVVEVPLLVAAAEQPGIGSDQGRPKSALGDGRSVGEHRAVDGGDDRQSGMQRREQGQMHVQHLGPVRPGAEPAGELCPGQGLVERLQRIMRVVADAQAADAGLAPAREGLAAGKNGDLVPTLAQAAGELENVTTHAFAGRKAVVGEECEPHRRSARRPDASRPGPCFG